MSREHGGTVSPSSVRTILTRDLKLFPNHIKHKLNENDIAQRLEMCEWFRAQFEQNPDWVKQIWFTDESHFTLTGRVNSKNSVYWSSNPPQHVLERPLHSKNALHEWHLAIKESSDLTGLKMAGKLRQSQLNDTPVY